MTTQVRINVLTKSYPHKKFCLRIKQFKKLNLIVYILATHLRINVTVIKILVTEEN